jgi:uncharacterized protein YndB with AHSA1/START domain
MTVTSIQKDTQGATMAVTAEFDAATDRVWQLWADPRLLERWWGPPTYPATVTEHQLSVGGTVAYFMTGPEGDRYHGLWRVVEVEPAKRLVFEDSFADSGGKLNPEMPTTMMEVTFVDRAGGGTTMTILSTFPSTEAMEKLLAMGMDEGLSAAIGQMDALLADAS